MAAHGPTTGPWQSRCSGETRRRRLWPRLFVLAHAETRRGHRIDANAERTNRAMTTNHNNGPRRAVSRRAFLKTTAGTAALLGAVRTNFPFGVHVAEAAGPEVTKANLGFIALTDAAPLFVAKAKGIFAKYGMPDGRGPEEASTQTRTSRPSWCRRRRWWRT